MVLLSIVPSLTLLLSSNAWNKNYSYYEMVAAQMTISLVMLVFRTMTPDLTTQATRAKIWSETIGLQWTKHYRNRPFRSLTQCKVCRARENLTLIEVLARHQVSRFTVIKSKWVSEQKEIAIPKYTPRYRNNSRMSLSTMAEINPSRYTMSPNSTMSKTKSISNLSLISNSSRRTMSKSKSTMNLSKASVPSKNYVVKLYFRCNFRTQIGR